MNNRKVSLLCVLFIILALPSSAFPRSPNWMRKDNIGFVHACRYSPAKEVKKLIKSQDFHHLNAEDEKGESPLSAALVYNPEREAIVQLLIKAGASPYKALMTAIEETDNQARVEILKAFPTVINEVSEKEPFAILCAVASYEVIEEKLKSGEPPNVYGLGAMKPLYFAARYNPDPKIINLLIDYGAESDNAHLMMSAAEGGNIKVIEALLKSGVKVDSIFEGGITALIYVSAQPQTYKSHHSTLAALEGIKALIKAGANVNAKDFLGNTPLTKAATFKHVETVKVLIDAGADVNMPGLAGNTPLICACLYSAPPQTLLNILLDSGANPKVKGEKGRRAIDYARQHKELAGTEAFLRLVRESR